MPATRPHRTPSERRTGATIRPYYPQMDHPHSVALAQPQPDKINVSPTKTALHRTRLRVLHHKIFSVLFFYKPIHQSAPLLALCRRSPTESIEKNFSVFQYSGSQMDPS